MTTINHLHLGATDVSRTAAFYVAMFDFKVEANHGDGVFLRDPSGFLIALDPVNAPMAAPAWFHIGFCRESAAAVKAEHRKAKVLGATIARDLLESPGEFASFFLLDPDGVRIEVSWHAN